MTDAQASQSHVSSEPNSVRQSADACLLRRVAEAAHHAERLPRLLQELDSLEPGDVPQVAVAFS